MMDHYLDINIRPDPEFTMPLLMSALISKLHQALTSLESDVIGVSFPNYQLSSRTLGDRMRLHGTDSQLRKLMEKNWLTGMADHTECGELLQVPVSTQHCMVRRQQVKSNVERLRRRRMKRKGESYEQAAEAIPVRVEQRSTLPFADLSSKSTGEVFKLFIEQKTDVKECREGAFNSYGLSLGATVPWF